MSDETVYKAQVGTKTTNHLALALMIIGSVWFAVSIFHIDLLDWLWPMVFIMLPGAVLLWPSSRSTKEKQHVLSILAIPGGFLVAMGASFLALNAIDHMEGVAYAWPIFVAGAITGWSYARRFETDEHSQAKRDRLIRALLFLSAGLALFFEIFIFQSLPFWAPLILVGYGLYLWRQ